MVLIIGNKTLKVWSYPPQKIVQIKGNPKIVVGTGWVGDNYNDLGKFSIEENSTYAKKNNYDFVYFNEPVFGKDLKYHKYLQKMQFTLQHLDECDWFAWIDIDMIFINHEKRIEEYICNDSYLNISTDLQPKNNPNTGMFFIKSCEKSKALLKNILNVSLLEITKFANKHYQPTLWDQTALYVVLDKFEHFKDGMNIFRYGALWCQPQDSYKYENILAIHCTDGTVKNIVFEDIRSRESEEVIRNNKLTILKKYKKSYLKL